MHVCFQTAIKALTISLAIMLSACSVQQSTEGSGNNAAMPATLPADAKFALLPLLNVSQTPMASERVETILASLLHSKGVESLSVYPAQLSASVMTILDEGGRYSTALKWAMKEDFDYLITGSVEEWRYKAGLDGEPAIGITLKILDAKGQKVLWTATGARSGWGREAASMTAHEVLSDLLDSLELDATH